MKINIYGSRGSIARCHPSLHRYGGNTSCIEVESADGTRVVLDMGSGAYDLGQKLVKMGPLQNQHVLLSHSHWDHIQGFPFFAPLFVKGSKWNIYAPGGFSSSLQEKLSSQMEHEFFPITTEAFGADIRYNDLKEGRLELGDFHVTTQYINHTVLTLGYRLHSQSLGTSMAYITDHEMFNHALAHGYTPPEGQPTTPDDRHAEFFRGVDLLVHDTQYVASEYHKTEGYGHSTVEYVVDMALAVGVKQLALFHHDPLRTDDEIDAIVDMARERVRAAGGSLKVFAAADFSTIELERDPNQPLPTEQHQSWTCANQPKVLPTAPGDTTSTSSALTEVVRDTHQEVVVSHSQTELFDGLESDGLRVTHIAKGRPFLQSVPSKKPSLILVHYASKQDDYVLKNCKRLRESNGAWGKGVPYIVVVQTQELLDELRRRGDEAGVTDWVVEPCSQAYVRTRIRMGLSRHPCKWKPPRKPKTETARVRALRSLQLLDSTPEERFDRITKLVASVFAVPLVFVSLVDENRQWFKSAQWLCPMPEGPKPTETPREVSFCGHTILQNEPLVIPDATQDDRFAQNPFVADGLRVRFYAGCPISVPNMDRHDGTEHNIGTLCIIDQRPRDLDESQLELFREFAAMVKTEILTYVSLRQKANNPIQKKRSSSCLKPAGANTHKSAPPSTTTSPSAALRAK